MKKIIVSVMMAAICLSAAGQDIKDSEWGKEDLNLELGDSKWEIGIQIGFMYNYSIGAPEGMSPSGLGMELTPIEMRWNGWKGGYITVGILDMFFDWQFLQSGYNFSTITPGEIIPVMGKGTRFNFGIGFPVGISQNFGKDFGISIAAVPALGFYNYRNTSDDNNFHIKSSFYPKKDRYKFQLDVKANIWYGNIGVVVRYSPFKAVDVNTNILSVGIAFRS